MRQDFDKQDNNNKRDKIKKKKLCFLKGFKMIKRNVTLFLIYYIYIYIYKKSEIMFLLELEC